jgi:hypothetical protein
VRIANPIVPANPGQHVYVMAKRAGRPFDDTACSLLQQSMLLLRSSATVVVQLLIGTASDLLGSPCAVKSLSSQQSGASTV